MGRFGLKTFFDSIKKNVKKHVPENFEDRIPGLLIGLGLFGWATTTVLAVKATPKAIANIKNEQDSQQTNKLSKKDIFKVTWKCYLIPTITGVLSSGCILVAHSVDTRKKTAYAIAYSLSESALKEYEQKVIDVVGEEKNDDIKESIVEENKAILKTQCNNNLPIANLSGFMLGDNVLCYDEAIGGYYFCTINKLDSVKNYLNDKLNNSCMTIDLNDYKDALRDEIIPLPGFSLDHTSVGEEVGWNTMYKIDIKYDSMIFDGRIPCLYIKHVNPPIREYDK